MTTPEEPSKISPLIFLGSLACVSLGSVFFTYNNTNLPGIAIKERKPVSSSQLRDLQDDLRHALEQVPNWERFCGEASSILAALSFEQSKKIRAFELSEQPKRQSLPQRERDAWSRCQTSRSNPLEFRSHYCFHLSSSQSSDPLWKSSVNLLEMNIEWYQKGRKAPLRCVDLENGERPEELAVYYAAYWAHEKKGKNWKFDRLAGGLRLPIQWRQQQASR